MGFFNIGGYKSLSVMLLSGCLEHKQLHHAPNWVRGFCARIRKIFNTHKVSWFVLNTKRLHIVVLSTWYLGFSDWIETSMPASVHCTDFWFIICCRSRCNLLSWTNYKLPPPSRTSTSCSDSSRQSWRFKLVALEDGRSLAHARCAGWLFSEHFTYPILCISITSFPTILSKYLQEHMLFYIQD